MKKSMKEKYLENKSRLDNIENDDKIDIDTYNKLVIECEEIIAKNDLILKLIELFMVPLILTTLGTIMSLYNGKRLMAFSIFVFFIIIEFFVVGITYYKFYMSKLYSEKYIKILTDYLNRQIEK